MHICMTHAWFTCLLLLVLLLLLLLRFALLASAFLILACMACSITRACNSSAMVEASKYAATNTGSTLVFQMPLAERSRRPFTTASAARQPRLSHWNSTSVEW